ncbi:MAG: TraR/DksA family transcriptional regulator [Alphaproteobacteria bacterium]|nr:MAG: TraR/DksA family transcriptional regulator [Alphaproteobacteria bacterium]
MGEIDTREIRRRLLARLDEVRSQSATTGEARAAVELDQSRVGRLSRMDALQGQAMAQATERRRQQELLRIEAALKRLEEGDYGYCVSCGDEIALKRLDLDPSVASCVKCASGQS